ncbi:hypothetical protein SESBI_05204 [Sesbania bispinosa]|nr:hypothetical protein SESBI_05204 [Sesbania bispinosa]
MFGNYVDTFTPYLAAGVTPLPVVILQLFKEGTFIVNVTIVSVLRDEQWWCGACKCHKDVTPDGGLYYSPNCSTHVVEVIPRGLKAGEHPSKFLGLIGKELLFKVEKIAEYAFNYYDSFGVKKVCAELEIIQQFKKSFIVESPLKPHFLEINGEDKTQDAYDSTSDDFETLLIVLLIQLCILMHALAQVCMLNPN